MKSLRTGNRAAVTKLEGKFEELKKVHSETGNIYIKKFKRVESSLIQKRDILSDIQQKLMEVLSDDDIVQEIADTDEYMFNLDEIIGELEA